MNLLWLFSRFLSFSVCTIIHNLLFLTRIVIKLTLFLLFLVYAARMFFGFEGSLSPDFAIRSVAAVGLFIAYTCLNYVLSELTMVFMEANFAGAEFVSRKIKKNL